MIPKECDDTQRSLVVPRRVTFIADALRWLAQRAWFVENEVAGLARLVKPGNICIDIGAEYGLYTWTLASLVGSRGRVHCIEPQPSLARFLRLSGSVLSAHHVTVHEVALGDDRTIERSTMSLPFRGPIPVHGRAFLSHGSHGLGSNEEFSRHRLVPVSMTTLDQLTDTLGLDRVDFIKIDVEGAEAALIAGGKKTIEKFRPVLMIELEERHLGRFGKTVGDVVADLVARDYHCYFWRDRDWVRSATLAGAGRNLLFVPTEVAGRVPERFHGMVV